MRAMKRCSGGALPLSLDEAVAEVYSTVYEETVP